MDGVYFLLNIIAIGLLMWWVAENDRPGLAGKTHGLFAMLDTAEPAAPPAASPRDAATPGWRARRNGGTKGPGPATSTRRRA
jgi:hypothetical protein